MAEKIDDIVASLLEEAKQHEVACILLSNAHADQHGLYEVAAGFSELTSYSSPSDIDNLQDLKFGFLAYDFKNKIEKLSSNNPAAIPVPDCFFFKPAKYYLQYSNGQNICNFKLPNPDKSTGDFQIPAWIGNVDDIAYLANIDTIKNQILDGDYYELNYCTQYSAKASVDPFGLFWKLNNITRSPFAAFFKFHDTFLLCASPERFLCKREGNLISQPIKGTIHRSKNAEEDDQLMRTLKTSEKDIAENVMIADLVRNDISRVCKPGTVLADKVCELKSYSHVHQLVTTISGQLNENVSFEDIINATFPMGSMTGAPKIKVMETIDKLEDFQRGWYSGSIGIINNGEFDLNVIIRSVQYNAQNQLLVYNVGGAITYDSVGEDELAECQTKAAGILQALKAI